VGRPLRRHEPGTYYLVTTRCHQARFLLRPGPDINDAVLRWLARAQAAFPDVRIFALCVLSNHLHLVVRDDAAELAPWASYFLGNLARSVNRIRNRSGSFFERRYSAEPILDDEALLDRIVYVVANPVKAGLCRKSQDWPGVVLVSRSGLAEAITVPETGHRVLSRKRHAVPSSKEENASDNDTQSLLIVDPAPDSQGANGRRLRDAIEAREREIQNELRSLGRKPLTRRQVLAQDWHAAPKQPARSHRPSCHTTVRHLREAFSEGFRHFTDLFREASERLRAGKQAAFPHWCYRPGHPLLRPTIALA
jgi:REP element-mobilizing transposase RayT